MLNTYFSNYIEQYCSVTLLVNNLNMHYYLLKILCNYLYLSVESILMDKLINETMMK